MNGEINAGAIAWPKVRRADACLTSNASPRTMLSAELIPASRSPMYFALEFSSSEYVRLGSFESVTSQMHLFNEERDVLRFAVKNLWRVYRYNQHYIGLLTGGVTEEDFTAAAERFAVVPKDYTDEEIRRATKVILPLINDDDLTPADMAAVLSADPHQLQLTLGV